MTNSMIPYSFSPGTKARADEVNANFVALADKIDENKLSQTNDVKEINSTLSQKADKTELINEHTVSVAGTNLNDYQTKGVYVFTSLVTPANIPTGNAGMLIVTGDKNSVIKQIWFCDGYNSIIFYRNLYGTSWGPWSNIMGEYSYGNPGYASLPNGIKIQWGNVAAANITYPIAFSALAVVTFSKQGWAADRTRSDTGFNYQNLAGFSVGSMGVFDSMCWIAVGY